MSQSVFPKTLIMPAKITFIWLTCELTFLCNIINVAADVMDVTFKVTSDKDSQIEIAGRQSADP